MLNALTQVCQRKVTSRIKQKIFSYYIKQNLPEGPHRHQEGRLEVPVIHEMCSLKYIKTNSRSKYALYRPSSVRPAWGRYPVPHCKMQPLNPKHREEHPSNRYVRGVIIFWRCTEELRNDPWALRDDSSSVRRATVPDPPLGQGIPWERPPCPSRDGAANPKQTLAGPARMFHNPSNHINLETTENPPCELSMPQSVVPPLT